MAETEAKSSPDLRKSLHLLALGFGRGLASKVPVTFGAPVAGLLTGAIMFFLQWGWR